MMEHIERTNSKYKLLLKKSANEEWFVHSVDGNTTTEYRYETSTPYYYEDTFDRSNYLTIYPLILIAIVATIYIFASCVLKFNNDDSDNYSSEYNAVKEPNTDVISTTMLKLFFLSGSFWKRAGVYFLGAIPLTFSEILDQNFYIIIPYEYHEYLMLCFFAVLVFDSIIVSLIVKKIYEFNIDYINKKFSDHSSYISKLRTRMGILHIIVYMIAIAFIPILIPDNNLYSRMFFSIFRQTPVFAFLYFTKPSRLEHDNGYDLNVFSSLSSIIMPILVFVTFIIQIFHDTIFNTLLNFLLLN